MQCDICHAPMRKVIYMGLPGLLCTKDGCNLLTGLAAYAPPIATDTEAGPMFAFQPYEGSYWVALWHWICGS